MSRYSFAPKIWTSKTIKNLIERSYSVCSNYDLLDEELKHFKTVFNEKKNYPKWTICQIKNQLRSIILERKIVTLSTLTIQHHGRKQKNCDPFVLPYHSG